MAQVPRAFVGVALSFDDDTLCVVLGHVKDDVALVHGMRTCAQFARCTARVLRERHGLEREQLAGYVAALLGKNVFITGGAGCGKSFVSKLIVKAARKRMNDDAVAVCAPTALAAAALGVRGMTLDRLMGTRKLRTSWPTTVISFEEFQRLSGKAGEEEEEEEEEEGGRMDPGDVFVPVESKYARERLLLARTILIDEVSMVSAAKLELLFIVLSHYGVEWENTQFIIVGDFAQLKPICPKRSPEYSAERGGFFAFRSPEWKKLRLVSVPLAVNRRCRSFEWNSCLDRLRMGEENESLWDRIKALTAAPTERKEAAMAGCVGIFGKNDSVKEFNEWALEALPGPLRCVASQDEPTEWDTVPKRMPALLWLKEGCSVLVTRNIRGVSYNGASGVLSSNVDWANAMHDGVNVELDAGGERQKCIPSIVDSKVYTRNKKKQEGKRRQLPLQVASAFTVHKAQGRSISRPLHVDAATFFGRESGMVYVALSRTTDPARLAIANPDELKQKAHIDPQVLRFHRSLQARPLPRWA